MVLIIISSALLIIELAFLGMCVEKGWTLVEGARHSWSTMFRIGKSYSLRKKKI